MYVRGGGLKVLGKVGGVPVEVLGWGEEVV